MAEPVKDYDPNQVSDYLRYLHDWALLGLAAEMDEAGSRYAERKCKVYLEKINGCYDSLRSLL